MKIILNHPMVLVVEENNAYVVKIRMRDGRYALQSPFPADQRGIIGALTLALDVLAGKIMLTGIEAPSNVRPLPFPERIALDVPKDVK
jgi:hypothetical protein